MARPEGHRRPRRRHRASSDMARGMGGQCRAPLHSWRHPRRADRPWRRLGDGAKARPRCADHRHARGLSRGRVAGRSHHQGQGHSHGRPVLDVRGFDLRRARQVACKRPRHLFHRAAPTAEGVMIFRQEVAVRTLIAASILAVLPILALAADNPDWAYPVTPRDRPPPDAVILKTLPGSSKQYTQAQIDDPFNPPDWYPDQHAPAPSAVTK